MKVSKLIAELGECCQDAEIHASCLGVCFHESGEVEEHSIWLEIHGVAKMDEKDEIPLLILGGVVMA